MRLALGVEYCGTGFSGWERQRDRRTVQAELERALAVVADRPVRVVCAGRTDAGVHGLGQVVHFDTDAARPDRAWLLGTNSNLPEDVAVQWVKTVPDDFHARFSARSRHYRYVILCGPARPAVASGRATWVHAMLDLGRMREAASLLLGEHDFSAYRALACQAKSPVRTVHRLELERHGRHLWLDVVANAFLHHMVRNIAGVLIDIGSGKREPRWAREVLETRDRTLGGVTAPPDGLYLMGVGYPPRYLLPRVTVSPGLW